MTNLAKAAVVLAAAALVSQAALAQTIPQGDLAIGFTSTTAGVTQDYVQDLGPIATLNMNPLVISHLGGLINPASLAAAFPGADVLNIGATVGVETTHAGDYMGITTARTGSNAIGVAGTESAPPTPSSGNNITAAATDNSSIPLGVTSNTGAQSFSVQANTLTVGGLAQNLATPILTTLSGSVLALDLFSTTRGTTTRAGTPASPYAYLGQLDLNLSNPNGIVADYIPAGYVVSAVPEPTTYGVLAGAGLLALSLRRQLARKNA